MPTFDTWDTSTARPSPAGADLLTPPDRSAWSASTYADGIPTSTTPFGTSRPAPRTATAPGPWTTDDDPWAPDPRYEPPRRSGPTGPADGAPDPRLGPTPAPGGSGGGGSFHDGLYPIGDDAPRPGSPLARASKKVSRLRQIEGLRGYSNRLALGLRYVGYFLCVLMCSAISHAAFQTTTTWRAGGKVMLFSASLMIVTAAIGTVAFTNYRNEIIRQMRHFVFGIAVLPGTGIALFLWAINSMLNSPSANNDAFASMLHNAVPIVYFCTVGLPAMVFVKVIAGMRTINRSRLDDEETMRIYSRQDGFQR